MILFIGNYFSNFGLMDVRVKHKKTGEISEMSAYMFSLLDNEYELAGNEPNKRPVIEPTPISEAIAEQARELRDKIDKEILDLNEEKKETEVLKEIVYEPIQTIDYPTKYEELFGKKPHHKMKPETIKEAVEAELKEKSFVVPPGSGE